MSFVTAGCGCKLSQPDEFLFKFGVRERITELEGTVGDNRRVLCPQTDRVITLDPSTLPVTASARYTSSRSPRTMFTTSKSSDKKGGYSRDKMEWSMRIDHHPKLPNRYLLLIVLASLSSPASVLLAQVLPVSAGTIYKESARSVVFITAKNEKGTGGWTGSGFIVSTDGKILTNYHVIRNSKEASVRLDNGDVYDTVEVLDVDRRKDIALLKIKAVDLQPVRIGSSSAIQIGDTVYSLSNPLGLFDNTLSEGIISGNRPMDGYRLLQITAPISHGSSGGPLFNDKGEVIGITVGFWGEGQSLNFAVPIDYARGMLASPSPPRPLASVYDPEPPSPTQSAPPASTEAAPSGKDPRKKAGETIDGSWSATVADAKASGNLNFNLIQNSDGAVVGTYTSSLGGGGSIKGQLTETDFRFELTQTIQGCPGIYKGDGTRIGDNIAGSYTGNDCLGDRGTGTFTMTRGTGIEPTSHSTSSVNPVPDDMRKSVGDFLATRILVWSSEDAQAVMGAPLTHRYAYDQAQNITGDIYSFRDPTLNADHIELSFDSKTSRLTNVYLYPARATTWEDCKKFWGKDASVAMKNTDGSKIYTYKNRHLNVLLDKNNRVINLGLY